MEHLYWIVMLDNIKDLMVGLLGSGIVLAIFSIFWWCYVITEKKKIVAPIIANIIMGMVIIIGAIGVTFIPSTKQAIAIITIPKIVNNEQIQEMPDNALRLINQKLKEWAEETEILPTDELPKE